jgi:hypothetical protein
MLTGRVAIDGRAAPNLRVLLISGDMSALLGSTTTADNGTFAVAVPESANRARVTLLVKVQGPLLAIVPHAVDLGRDGEGPHGVAIDTADGRFHRVEATVTTTSGWPPSLSFFVNPVHLEGVPAPLERFFNRRDERIVEGSFFKVSPAGKSFDLTVQAGSYRIGGGFIDYRRPNLAHPTFENYAVARVDADGEATPLPGDRSGGYLLEVPRDRRISLTLSVVPDEELSPTGL